MDSGSNKVMTLHIAAFIVQSKTQYMFLIHPLGQCSIFFNSSSRARLNAWLHVRWTAKNAQLQCSTSACPAELGRNTSITYLRKRLDTNVHIHECCDTYVLTPMFICTQLYTHICIATQMSKNIHIYMSTCMIIEYPPHSLSVYVHV